MRVIMTCGGTGGHIYPAVAIADEIKKRDKNAEILFVGAEDGMEERLVPASGYEIKIISSAGFNRKKLLKNIEVLKKVQKGRKMAKKILKDFKPDVVIGTGGYASAPVVKSAQKLGIPTYIHEQNAFPGMANKMLEARVEKVFLGFEQGGAHFRHPEKHVTAGNPVRADFHGLSREEARAKLGFGPDDFVLLAFGGSLGAKRINNAAVHLIETFNGIKDFKICLATGRYYYKSILEDFENRDVEIQDNISIMEYINDMASYLAAADLIISRSGALTVAEVTVCGKPAVFIPSPMVTGNHQYHNAKAVADKGGAIVIEEKYLDNEQLAAQILSLKNDPELLRDMAAKSRGCAPVNATGIICDHVFADIKK